MNNKRTQKNSEPQMGFEPTTLQGHISLRSWRYCVIKFRRRSRDPKKGSGDEAFEILMYLVCLPTFGITFSCFLIVPGIKLSQQKLKTALCKSLGPNKVYYWRC